MREPDASAKSPVVARVGSRFVTEHDVLENLLLFFRRDYFDALNQAVNDVVISLELARTGVVIDDVEVDRMAQEDLDRLRSEVIVQFGGEVPFEDFVSHNFRRALNEYRADLRRVARSRIALARLVRYEQLRRDRFEIRKIVVDERASAETILGKLEEGADFGILAEKESRAPSQKTGGKLPPVMQGVLNPDLEAAVLRLSPGEVSPIVETRESSRPRYHLIQLVRRIPGRSATYGDVRQEIEAGLTRDPLQEYEVAYWNEAMSRYYGIESVFDPARMDGKGF